MHLDSLDPEYYVSTMLGHLSGRQCAPRKDRADSHPSCLEKADVRARGSRRREEEAGDCKPRILGGKGVRTAVSRPPWRGHQPALSPCSRRTLTGARFQDTVIAARALPGFRPLVGWMKGGLMTG